MERGRRKDLELHAALDGLHNYLSRNNDKDLDGFYSVLIPTITFEGLEYITYKFNLIDFSNEII